MSTQVVCESLERRDQRAAAAALDPNYLLSLPDIRRVLGDEAVVYQAEPAAGGRTYLLAGRVVRRQVDGRGTLASYLAVIAVDPDGKPDPAFSGDGIAATSRRLSRAGSSLLPGILRVDDAGRVYFADATRVLRLTARGNTDRTFGTGGAIPYATDDRPTQLSDMVVTDDGVMVATFSTRRNVEHFAVDKIDGRSAVRTWEAAHDSGVAYDVNGKTVLVDSRFAQFARSHGRIVLARVESDGQVYPNTNSDFEPGATVIGSARQDVVVTRFDADGVGTDVIRREMKRSGRRDPNGFGEPEPTGLGAKNGDVGGNVLLGGDGRTVIVQSDRELLRINLKTRTARRSPLPGPDGPRPADKPGTPPDYQLFPDGGIGSFEQVFDRNEKEVTNLYRYRPDGTLDPTFGDGGKIVLDAGDFAAGKTTVVDQIFLDSAGRFNFLATGRRVGTSATLTLRRVI